MGDFTLIGTGSEWFWTMVSGLVVAVTFIVIYRQLKAQGAANAFQRIETVHVDGGHRSSSWPGCRLPVPSETERLTPTTRAWTRSSTSSSSSVISIARAI